MPKAALLPESKTPLTGEGTAHRRISRIVPQLASEADGAQRRSVWDAGIADKSSFAHADCAPDQSRSSIDSRKVFGRHHPRAGQMMAGRATGSLTRSADSQISTALQHNVRSGSRLA